MRLILGGPGTGKTTRLLGLIEERLNEGYAPEEIAFVSFTKKSITEAVERASIKFNLDKNRFIYFRTLHSLLILQKCRYATFGRRRSNLCLNRGQPSIPLVLFQVPDPKSGYVFYS